jgi:N-acetylneuraminic acid mutarotase
MDIPPGGAGSDETGNITYSYNKPLILTGKLPSGRGGNSIVFADNKLVSFGGHWLEGENLFGYSDETWLLDTEKLKWHQMQCSGHIPSPRYGHTAHILGSRMFIFGGKGPNGMIYNDIFFLDLIEWIWVPVNTVSPGPTPRFFHASEVVGRKVVIHGGWNESDTLGDIWIFNTDSFSWMQPKTSGFAPTPRYGHTLTLTPEGRLLVFGGCSISKDGVGLPKYNDDLRQLDTESMIWIRPRVEGQVPTGRYGHSALLMGNNKLVVFGGWGRGGCQTKDEIKNQQAYSFHVLDISAMTWWAPRRLSKKPMKHLFNHGACVAGDSTLLTMGGFDGRQATNGFFVVNFDFGDMN